ncbi:uncharacterized protein LOC127749482 [Frankliniella occidentalis]|uniref:Uncharacterized protein LOC127749482 n=1 Tax=Frankliniella occidentalis TaxID=133901 RepID=A0A9C6WZV4_FRAOC|nr:uncharacterized protein LOC127749482 [Frankliniella occidentalis]
MNSQVYPICDGYFILKSNYVMGCAFIFTSPWKRNYIDECRKKTELTNNNNARSRTSGSGQHFISCGSFLNGVNKEKIIFQSGWTKATVKQDLCSKGLPLCAQIIICILYSH